MVRGFAPFAAVFDARHICHGAEIVAIQGEQVVAARVLGVAEDGGLRIMTGAGATVIHAGEVSLRMRQ
jgi:biotin-(acetyl-CoA carboxylase) ligase